MDENTAREKIRALTDPKIDEVGLLLLNFGMELVACGMDTIIKREGDEVGQVDLLFVDKKIKRYFFIEVSIIKTKRSMKINNFFTKWRNKQNKDLIDEKLDLYPNYKIELIYFDLSGKESKLNSVLLEKNEHLLSIQDFEYFLDAYKKIGVCAKSDLFSYLYIKRIGGKNDTKQAIQFFLGNVRAFVYADSASNLLEYSYVFRRKYDESGYQRELKGKRIGKIAEQIKTKHFLAFPNAILISCPQESSLCNEPKDKTKSGEPAQINIPNDYYSCRVIDGQHRLLSFSKLSEKEQGSHFMPVVLFEGINKEDEEKTFIEINSKQEKMDRNLILLLRIDFEWDIKKEPDEFYEKQSVLVLKKLNETERSPLQNKVYIPYVLAETKGKITLNTLVDAIINNKFIGKKPLFQKNEGDIETPYKKIKGIFDLAKQKLPKYEEKGRSFWLTNTGVRILFRLVHIFEKNRKKKNIAATLKQFFDDLSGICTKQLFGELKESYGEGGANKKVEEIFKRVKRANRDRYKKLVTNLRKI